MSEDQELLARIGQLAGHINLHKTQPSLSQTTAIEQANARSSGSSVLRGHTAWKPQRPAPYQIAPGRGRGAYRPFSRNRSLVVNSGPGHSPPPRSLDSSTSVSTDETPQTAAAYVTTTGRHKQYINASVLAKVTEQRKRAIEESQQLKIQKHDQWERQRLQRYVAALDAEQSKSLAQGSQHTSGKSHEINIDGLRFQVLKGGSKLVRIFGEVILAVLPSFGAQRTGNYRSFRHVAGNTKEGKRPGSDLRPQQTRQSLSIWSCPGQQVSRAFGLEQTQ
ncbi:MAG: hypothetical protein LQ337_000809 [Flavoplaca oasis]|nr:MAG: hypothetical protein LQ337_000809 [Flavoplaca oasis]